MIIEEKNFKITKGLCSFEGTKEGVKEKEALEM